MMSLLFSAAIFALLVIGSRGTSVDRWYHFNTSRVMNYRGGLSFYDPSTYSMEIVWWASRGRVTWKNGGPSAAQLE